MMRDLMENAPVGLAFVDSKYRYVVANKSIAAPDDMPLAAHVGLKVQDVVPELWPKLEPIFDRVMSGLAVLNVDLRGDARGGGEVAAVLTLHAKDPHYFEESTATSSHRGASVSTIVGSSNAIDSELIPLSPRDGFLPPVPAWPRSVRRAHPGSPLEVQYWTRI